MKLFYEKFKLTDQHIQLLKRMYCYFENDTYDGAPAVNIKRPYGNSDVAYDVNEIGFNESLDENDDMPEKLIQKCLNLHQETGTALQICLSTASFKPGLYGRPDPYNMQKWEWISE